MNSKNLTRTSKWTVLLRVVICAGVIAIGLLGMKTLTDMNTPPVEKTITENAIQVETIPVQYENAQTWLTGFGEARPLTVVVVSPETSGRVIMVHPRLEKGEIVHKGDVLFKIDTESDTLSYTYGLTRLKALRRNLDLTEQSYLRTKKLFQQNKIGTLSEVENAEKEVNSLIDQISQLELAVASAEMDLKKATVVAPFDARVKAVDLEKGQYVSPGSASVTLADDSILEIHVSVDSEKAMRLLQFEPDTTPRHATRFSRLKPIPTKVTWSQGGDTVQQTGVLHRVLEFDATTRTLKLAVRIIDNAIPHSDQTDSFPIVEGMFCRVEIPGKPLSNVIRLPQQAVNSDSNVYVVKQNRLKTLPVSIKNREGKELLVTGGFNPGDQIIITHLSAPLENSLVDPIHFDQLAQSTRR